MNRGDTTPFWCRVFNLGLNFSELLHLATRVGRRPPILYLAAPSSCASVREAGTRRSLVCATWVKSQYCKVAPCLPLDGLSAKSEFSFVKRHSDSPPLDKDS